MVTVTILRPAETEHDDDGDPIEPDPDAIDPQRIELTGCEVAPSQSAEIHQRGRSGFIEALSLYRRGPADVRRTDQIEHNGHIYDVEGEPAVWPAGVVVEMTRVVG